MIGSSICVVVCLGLGVCLVSYSVRGCMVMVVPDSRQGLQAFASREREDLVGPVESRGLSGGGLLG